MDKKERNNQVAKISIFITSVFVIFLSFSYALINQTLTGTKRQTITAGNLELILDEDNEIRLENALPMYDEVGMIQEPFTFQLQNKTAINYDYTIKLVNINPESANNLDPNIVKYGLEKDTERKIDILSNQENMIIDKGIITENQIINYSLRLWLDSNIEKEEQIAGKTLSYKISIEAQKKDVIIVTFNEMSEERLLRPGEVYGELPIPFKSGYKFLGWYTESLGGTKIESTTIVPNTLNQELYAHWDYELNPPELTNGMIPVTYNEDTKQWLKADTNQRWYDYEKQWWANAVTVTEEKRAKYMSANVGTPLSMDDINTMWVWIPRYEYQYNNLENKYAGGTQAQPGEINLHFIKKTQIAASHTFAIPLGFKFGSVNLSGFWIGKFETTGDMSSACTNESCATTNLTVLPNKVSVSNQSLSSFQNAARSLQNSTNAKKYGFDPIGTGTMNVHMLDNAEWGIVAYLSQSKYGKYGNSNYEGANKEIYQNKSTERITGSSNGTPSTDIYNTQVSYDTKDTGYGASTTGTIYGVYDMSGGSWEYVTNTHGFGDGTASTETAGWYGDFYFDNAANIRGCCYVQKEDAGIFCHNAYGDGGYDSFSFRLAIAP